MRYDISLKNYKNNSNIDTKFTKFLNNIEATKMYKKVL